jgi:hypothetical protein
MMERDLANQKELRQAAESIPKNCNYTSPEAQNELISIWFELLQSVVVKRVTESSMYCVMADETRNKTNVEDMCVCVRHVDKKFVAHEYLLDIVALRELNAACISSNLLQVLRKTVGTDRLVAQSYDGASVMSGASGGVQALISAAVGRKIIYIHCFAHRLHLVVLKVLETSSHVTWLLETCQQLYNFFRRYAVAREYNDVGGRKLKRLLEQRWTGHHDSVNTVLTEFNNILETLQNIAASRLSESIEAAGLVQQLKHAEFMPVLKLTKDILDLLMPLNKAFQSETMDITTGIALIDVVRSTLASLIDELRSENSEKSDDVLVSHPEYDVSDSSIVDPIGSSYQTETNSDNNLADSEGNTTISKSRRSSRIIKAPKRLDDYICEIKQFNKQFNGRPMSEENVGVSDDSAHNDNEGVAVELFSEVQLKLLLAQAVMCELDNRFGEQQRAVYVAAASLATGTFTEQSLQPLVQAAVDAGLHVDCEMLVA